MSASRYRRVVTTKRVPKKIELFFRQLRDPRLGFIHRQLQLCHHDPHREEVDRIVGQVAYLNNCSAVGVRSVGCNTCALQSRTWSHLDTCQHVGPKSCHPSARNCGDTHLDPANSLIFRDMTYRRAKKKNGMQHAFNFLRGSWKFSWSHEIQGGSNANKSQGRLQIITHSSYLVRSPCSVRSTSGRPQEPTHQY